MKLKAYFAELIGTFVLVFMGCGAAVFAGAGLGGGNVGHLAVAFAFGLSIVAMAYVIGNISGCHINPAVSLAMLLDKRMSVTDFVGYVIGQCAGAVGAAAVLSWFVNGVGIKDQTLPGGLGTNGLTGVNGSVAAGLVIEVILTCIFVFVILGVTSDPGKKSIAGVVIGLTLTFVHIVGIPLTGTSVNPARSLGPALFAGGDALKNLWIFILAPLFGAALAVVIWTLVKNSKAEETPQADA